MTAAIGSPPDPLDNSEESSAITPLQSLLMATNNRRKQPVKRPMHVAIVGASGLVGQETIKILEERGFPIASIKFFGSSKSAGETLDFQGEQIKIEEISADKLKGVELAFFSATSDIAKKYAPILAEMGAVCIDKSSAFRNDPNVPLLVSGVNTADLAGFNKRRIIASPNCSTIQLVQILAPLHQAFGLKRVVVCTYQAASGAGKEAMEELDQQVRDMYNFREPKVEVLDRKLAFNAIPRISAKGAFLDDGSTDEEQKMVVETRRILGIPQLPISATCVRIPVFNSHSEAVHIEFTNPVDVEKAREILRKTPDVLVFDDTAQGLYPVAEDASGQDYTLVGRIRRDASVAHGLALWIVSDNLRTGAALNAVRVAEELCQHLA